MTVRHANMTALAALAISLGVIAVGTPSLSAPRPVKRSALAQPASQTVTQMADWVIAARDNRGLPFVIIDKVAAEVVVFDAAGRSRGAAPALLGLARGDDSVPGVGDRNLSAIRPGERTTPAGRFLAAYGPARDKHRVLWVDYGTAISLHPVVTANRKEQRLKRLQSPSPDDNRITYGCINVPAAFYEQVVRRTFTGTSGVVYILPETKPLDEVFPGFRTQVLASAARTGDAEERVDLGGSQQDRISDAASSAGPAAALVR
jgi:hypothetical protein